ncbi:MAG: hypothetical protein H0T84_14935 [Tatlockia sp.]|nr:hypothetical protein [Tatlockia sp.]
MKQKKGEIVVRKCLRLLWRLIVIVLQVAAEFASDKPTNPRHSAMKAKMLYDEGRIGYEEYSKSIYRND